jgi:hypothetical protein
MLLFGIGGGLTGFAVGERQGEQRAAAIAGALSESWDASRIRARDQFGSAIGAAASRLEKAASDIRAQVSMYHGCGSICGAIANRFGEELLLARAEIGRIELTPPADWNTAVGETGGNAALQPNGLYSNTALIAVAGMLCVAAALCFAIACHAIAKMRDVATERT